MIKPKLKSVNAFINTIFLACKNNKNGIILMTRTRIYHFLKLKTIKNMKKEHGGIYALKKLNKIFPTLTKIRMFIV
jgi:hypothetical protein